jgi:ADP-heptose:LPS heptosyltransferase
MVGPWSRDVLERNPHLDQVITCPFPGFTRRPKGLPWSPYLLLRREAARLRREGFDLAINLRFDFWWGAMLAYYAGIPRRVGYDVAECLPFLSQPLPYQPGRHEVEQNLRLVRALVGEEVSAPQELVFPITEEEEAFAQGVLSSWPGGGPLVFIHPGSGAPVKLWRPQGFAEVAQHLVDQYGARIVVTGVPGEEELVRQVAHAMTHPPTILIGTTLGQMAALLRHCDLVVGIDSGLMHLAVTVGAPTVHLYGPVDPAAFGPWGPPERHLVVRSDRDCIPCNRLDYRRRQLARHPCVRDIQANQVIAAAERLLRAARPALESPSIPTHPSGAQALKKP